MFGEPWPTGYRASSLTIVLDRESEPHMSYTLHPECLGMLRDAIPSPMRFVEMGPAALGSECGYFKCVHNGGE